MSSSVEDSNFSFEGDISAVLGLRIVAPYSKLKYHRLSVVYGRGVIEYPSYPYIKDPSRVWNYVRSLKWLFEMLKEGKRGIAVVVDKESMLRLAREFEKIGWEVEYGRDFETDTVDYVVVRRPSSGVILLFHPHGRCALGVDPPFRDKIESVIIGLGLRGYPRYIVPVPRVYKSVVGLLEGKGVGVDSVPGVYVIVRGGFLYVYDIFSLKYDAHLLVQVVGRFFLSKSMRFVLVNPRYDIRDIKFFVLVHYLDSDRYSNIVGRVYKVNYVDKFGREYTEFQLRLEGLRLMDVKPVLREVDVEKFMKRSNSVVVDLNRVRYTMYNRLRNVYNSLRYVKKQLNYGRQPDMWWFIKKVVYLVNGFDYARLNNASVPIGLRKAFQKYVNEGLEGLLHYIYNRYLRVSIPIFGIL